MIKSIPLSITDLQDSLKKKEFSCVELVDAYLERIEKLNPALNAYLTVSKDEAYEKAKENDKKIADLKEDAFKENLLLGVCIGYKDNYLTKGVRTTAASKVLESYVPAYSATVVNKLNKVGCIMLGKLNMDAWAHGSSGEYSDFGPSKNPWNKEYVPGGSSSGSGAALAANLAMVTTGTDTCGSIRLPANYCGKVGLKPTYGSVSRYGIIAMASSLDCVGHLTHNVADSEKIFNVTKGVDGFDATLKEEKEVSLKPKLKIGVPKEFFVDGLDLEVKQAVTSAIEVFRKQGMEIVEVSLPNTKYGISVYYIIQPAEVSSNLGRYDGVRYGEKRGKFGDEAKRRIMLGTYVLSAGYYDAYYLKAMKVRSKIIQEVEEAFNKVDVLIAPVTPSAPFKFGDKVNDPLKMYLTDILAATANLSGIPSLAIPNGFNQKGLPLGFQIMAPRFSEKILFELGKLFEEKTNYKPSVSEI